MDLQSQYTIALTPVEKAIKYYRTNMSQWNFDVLKDMVNKAIIEIWKLALEHNINQAFLDRFLEENPVLNEARDIITQHPNNVVYLSGRLTPY